MRSGFAVLGLTLLVTAFPAYAAEGNAWLVTDTGVWVATGDLSYAVTIGTPLIYKSVPYVGPGRLLSPRGVRRR